jgi:hypothetical protein
MEGEVQGRKQRREDFVKNQAVMTREIKEHEISESLVEMGRFTKPPQADFQRYDQSL